MLICALGWIDDRVFQHGCRYGWLDSLAGRWWNRRVCSWLADHEA